MTIPTFSKDTKKVNSPPVKELKSEDQPHPPIDEDTPIFKDKKTGLEYYPNKIPVTKKMPTNFLIDCRAKGRQVIKKRLKTYSLENDIHMSQAAMRFISEGLIKRGY